ncbi:OLC1v1015046C1 [Oldenlandia corymbosa var. corymbosa]|uniref:beta-galactosidase n=1 Tax=Oldenlandia corymbosa var. corymbosa TaxID=529605 RepID=A0AAV1E288_OLDCO|nr:OLC1v1015046C1 [Oldenlandia corymbosa var. corymbosa]
MAHGGTNFGFYNGANTGANELDYEPDLTSYDYDAPIRESGDVDNAKYEALRDVILRYSWPTKTTVPPDNKKAAYGHIRLHKATLLFDIIDNDSSFSVVESENPLSMESVGQMFGFLLYVSEYTSKGDNSTLSIPKVHDRAQVFVSCASSDDDRGKRPTYVGTIARWSNRPIHLPHSKCASHPKIYILVENMGRVNYGRYMFDRKGILSPVYVDGRPIYKWKMFSIPFPNLNEGQNTNVLPDVYSNFFEASSHWILKHKNWVSLEPTLYRGQFTIDQVRDTYISFNGWSKGVAFVNGFNIGRYWPSVGPQCSLYVPAPILQEGENILVMLELESASNDPYVSSNDQPDFTCMSTGAKLN